jgi:hypothetical protein
VYSVRKTGTRQLTSSDTGYAIREVADDRKGLFFADEGKVDVVVCEVGGELLYTTGARRSQGEFITGLLWDMMRQSMTRRLEGGYLAICEEQPSEWTEWTQCKIS